MISRLGPSFFGTTNSLEKYIGRVAGVGIFLMTPEERRRGMNSLLVGSRDVPVPKKVPIPIPIPKTDFFRYPIPVPILRYRYFYSSEKA